MLAPPVLGPLLLGLALAQGLLTLWLLLLVRRLWLPQTGPDMALVDLAERVEPHLRQLFETLDERQRQAAALVQEADQLVMRLRSASLSGVASNPSPSAADQPAPALEARAVARKLLAEGQTIDDVATQTGLPAGELRILANLLAARQKDSDAA